MIKGNQSFLCEYCFETTEDLQRFLRETAFASQYYQADESALKISLKLKQGNFFEIRGERLLMYKPIVSRYVDGIRQDVGAHKEIACDKQIDWNVLKEVCAAWKDKKNPSDYLSVSFWGQESSPAERSGELPQVVGNK